MERLLLADEDRLRSTLRAHAEMEKDRNLCMEALSGELSDLLLRYNAACANDRMRQSLADSLTAAARDQLALLKAGGAEKELASREVRAIAPLLLLLAAALAAAALPLAGQTLLVGGACLAGALVCAFLSGRLWHKAQAVTVRATLDPEQLWLSLRRTCETIDRKIEDFCGRAVEWRGGEQGESEEMDPEELRFFGELLEALWSQNGDYALRQLKKLPPWLRQKGVETEEYSPETAGDFELLPSKKPPVTLRPALLQDGRLVQTGRATEQVK